MNTDGPRFMGMQIGVNSARKSGPGCSQSQLVAVSRTNLFFCGWWWAQKAPEGWRSPRRKRCPKTCRLPIGGVVQLADARDLLSGGWLVNRLVLNDAAI